MNVQIDFSLKSPITNKFVIFGDIYSGDNLEQFKSSSNSFIEANRDQIANWLAGLSGEYSFVSWQEHRHEAFLARDHFGVAPLYIYKISNLKWAISSSLKSIVAAAEKLTLNRKYLSAIQNDNYSLLSQTSFNEIQRCPPGHYAILNTSGLEFHKYWGLEQLKDLAKKSIDTQSINIDSYIEKGRQLVTEVCANRVTRHDKIACLLSGGLDSTLIANVVDRQFLKNSNSEHFYCASIDYKNNLAADKLALFEAREKLSCKNEIFELEKINNDIFNRPKTIYEKLGSIFYSPTLWLYRPMLEACQNFKADVVLTGLGGDDLFQPNSTFLSEYPLLTHLSNILETLNSPFKNHRLEKEFWLNIIKPRIIRLIKRTIIFAFGRSYFENVSRFKNHIFDSAIKNCLNYRFLNWGGYTFAMEQEQEMAQAHGLRFSYPLLDIRLFKYVFNAPNSFYFSAEHQKIILRRISDSIVGPSAAWRSSTQDYSEFERDVIARQKSWPVKDDDLLKAWHYDQCVQTAEKHNDKYV